MASPSKSVKAIWFQAIEQLVLTIHCSIYKGNRKSCRYRLGQHFIAQVENNQLVELHDFESRRSVVLIDDEPKVKILTNVSTLAENITDKIPMAIRAITSPEVFLIYSKANRLNIHWVKVRFNFILNNEIRGN